MATSKETQDSDIEDQLEHHYGIIAARLCGLPESVVSKAEEIVPSIKVKTLRCDEHSDIQRTLLRQDILQRLTPLVSYSSLKGNGVTLHRTVYA